MHWNRLKKLVCLPHCFWNLDGWLPQSGKCRPETLFFDKMQDPRFFYSLFMTYLLIYWLMYGLLILFSAN